VVENIYAYTEPSGNFPGYVSINELDDGTVEFIVRHPRDQISSSMILTWHQFEDLAQALYNKVMENP